MKTILQLEEFALCMLGVIIFSQLSYAWWWFPLLLLTPDIGMLGYLVNSKVGAFTYNFFHHRGIAVLLLIIGYFYENQFLLLCGVILFSHIAFDRILGYGLKYSDSFNHTHLGTIGKK